MIPLTIYITPKLWNRVILTLLSQLNPECAACINKASTSFANPAITIARSMTNSFSGIAPADVPMFIGAQLVGALVAMAAGGLLFCNMDWRHEKTSLCALQNSVA